ncbi:RDD family protein [Lysinibacillus macroides]|uniref:RDD family protein n=1 Tax=Lysinibacillus macroides TaxID=33935 RepID=A0A0N0CUS1_9BACI|nr:RDD family protein [Lysinibacillus macroides]KOY80731.1 RDD family protein [Lysinibacillus macroides]QPR69873.1 RDD family protein [Lysinibacillus macroides]
MESITKKRTATYMIDVAISTTVTFGIEYFLRKKVKNEAVHALVIPTAVMWTLGYVQFRKKGQTIGYKAMELVLESEDGQALSGSQLIKRMAYRDTLSTFDYIKNPQAFAQQNGQRLPHDRISGALVQEQLS